MKYLTLGIFIIAIASFIGALFTTGMTSFQLNIYGIGYLILGILTDIKITLQGEKYE